MIPKICIIVTALKDQSLSQRVKKRRETNINDVDQFISGKYYIHIIFVYSFNI